MVSVRTLRALIALNDWPASSGASNPTPPYPCPGALFKLSPGLFLSPCLTHTGGLVVCNANIPVCGYGCCWSGPWHVDWLPCLTSDLSYHYGPAWPWLCCVPMTAAGMQPEEWTLTCSCFLSLISDLPYHHELAWWSRLLAGPGPALFNSLSLKDQKAFAVPWGKRSFKDLRWQKHLHSEEVTIFQLNSWTISAPGSLCQKKCAGLGRLCSCLGKPMVWVLPNLDWNQLWPGWGGLALWLVWASLSSCCCWKGRSYVAMQLLELRQRMYWECMTGKGRGGGSMAAFSQLWNCILRHIRARWQEVLHLEQGATLSNAAAVKCHHAANVGTQAQQQSLPCVTSRSYNISGSIKLGFASSI